MPTNTRAVFMSEQKMEEETGKLRAFIERIKQETGGDDEIVKQCVADLNAQQRQDARNHFESRQTYIRQIAERDLADRRGIIEYGLQSLRWSFLLNAGAIAVVAAYVGGGLGRSGSISSFAPLLKALWPFAMGCVLVTLAGTAGYFNYCYAQASFPSPEALHNFMDPTAKIFPTGQSNSWQLRWSRTVAISFGVASVMFFLYGVYRVLRAALG
jgi:hypothetical protein